MRYIAAALVLLLSACVSTPYRVPAFKPSQPEALTDKQLCVAYMYDRKSGAREEIERRGVLSPLDWQHAPASRYAVGMTELGVLCSMGEPTRKNITTTGAGSREQWVYDRGRSAVYLYFEAGKLTAMQR